MVQAEVGQVILAGKSGRQYSLTVYVADVAGTDTKFSTSGNATATSQSFYIMPEDCIIKDFSIPTGLTATTNLVIKVNDVSTGNLLNMANCVNTLAYRAIPNIGISAGRKFTMTEA